MIRRVVLGSVSVLALASTAFAADIYSPPSVSYAPPVVVPVATWTGFYLGVNGGYGGYSGLGFRDVIAASPAAVTYLAAGSTNLSGGFGGGQVGYNYQLGNFVVGIETDIQGSDIRGNGAISAIPTGGGLGRFVNADLNVDYFGTVRGRLGYALGGTLIYATGGFAYGGVNSSFVYNDTTTTTGRVSNSQTLTGWTAGAGIEYKISPSWSLKGEYQFIDLSSNSTNAYPLLPTSAGSQKGNTNVEFNTVRIGLNYIFNAAYEPLPMK
jgi:outer membrane immunogenic protein